MVLLRIKESLVLNRKYMSLSQQGIKRILASLWRKPSQKTIIRKKILNRKENLEQVGYLWRRQPGLLLSWSVSRCQTLKDASHYSAPHIPKSTRFYPTRF